MVKFRHRVLDTSTERSWTQWLPLQEHVVVNVCVLFCTTNNGVIMGSVQKNATSLLLNTSAASVVTLEVAGLLSALCFEWILTLLFMLLLDNLKCFPSLLNFIFAWLTCVGTEWLFDLWSFAIFPDVDSIHGWSAIGRDFCHRGAVTVYWVCYQGYQMQCAHRTHSHPKNRLREHELVLVALLVFCASLGSWLHVSFLSFLRLLSWFLPSFLGMLGVRTCLGLSEDIDSLLIRDWLLAAVSETLNLALSSKTWRKCSKGHQVGISSVYGVPGVCFWDLRRRFAKRIPCCRRGGGFTSTAFLASWMLFGDG